MSCVFSNIHEIYFLKVNVFVFPPQVYSVFLHVGASVFLIYVQIFHVYLPSKRQAREQSSSPRNDPDQEAVISDDVINPAAINLSDLTMTSSSNANALDCTQRSVPRVQSEYNAARKFSNNSTVLTIKEEDEEDLDAINSCPDSPRSYLDSAGGSSCLTPPRRSGLILGDAMKTVRRRRMTRRRSSGIERSTEVNTTDDVHDFLAMNHGTASFSHEATSFYMRLGTLCEYMVLTYY